ncbi:MAG: hypothetical protein JSR82_23975, partial [Verrucomicrobia bacterium]|nr:hypothetical protein [Verrucomicrobiota bacterium]
MHPSSLSIGQNVRHPDYGVGVVKALTEHTADILFAEGRKTVAPASSGLTPAEPSANLSGLEKPLAALIREVVAATLQASGVERPDADPAGLAQRWQGGTLRLLPADLSLQPKDVELEVFFHKIVMMRNNLRTLEQKGYSVVFV